LNVSLLSEKEIEVSLESLPKMISLILSSSTEATTTLTLKGFQPNKKYYKYEDSYKNGIEILTDENGNYTWIQDLSKPHHVWFQEEKGTIFLPEDCAKYGNWDETERICKLNQNVTTSIEISTSTMTLDCQGHNITGQLYFDSSNSVYGVYLNSLEKITIKNCTINNFIYGIYIHNSSYITISTNNIANNGHGVGIFYSTYNTVLKNTIENNSNGGIWLFYSSDYNSLFQNTITNSYIGISLDSSSNNTIYKNNIASNILRGIDLYSSNHNIISENDISYSSGFSEPHNNFGVYIHDSSNFNVIFKNIIHHNSDEGILIESSSNNAIFENDITDNGYGISLWYNSSNNKIYHNNFIDNVQKPQARIFRYYGRDNFFDNGYSSGGNYWSDYQGKDEKSGPNQDQEGSDGIGDTPYTFEGGQDKYPFMKENGWLLKENQLPIPIINFSPKNPVKGVKVKFDASSSTDPDGKIKEFFWEIKKGEEILATSTATTTTFAFPENGEYQITLTATDEDGATSSTSTIIKVEPFSFAIITDLHIGRGYPDYDGPGFDDGYNGEEYYLTQRLRNVVNWINENKEKYSFKFVAVLGDIADTAEKSEFCKAKEILDELKIPYVPIFGNHDVWPYTEKESASTTLGEDFFERIFWSTTSIPCENASSTRNFEILLKEFNFERDIQNLKFKNFIFNYGGINFIGLDFNSREKEKCENCGVKGEGVLHNETINWLKDKLNQLGGKEPVIIFSHAPFAEPFSRGFYKDSVLQNIIPFPQGNFSGEELEKISQILQDYENISEGQQILANFGGHIHGFEKLGKELKFFGQFSPIDLYLDANWQYPSLSTVPVLTTEALMVGGNEKDLSNKGLVRIVKIEEKEKIDFSEIEFKEPALNPYITFEFKSKIVGNFIYPCLIFVPQTFTKREIDYFLWDFGDGKTERTSPLIWEGKVIHCYSPSNLPATYNVTLIAVDKETNKSEYITKKVEIREGIIPKIIKIGEDLKDKVELISMELNEKVTEFGRTMRDWVWIKVKHSPSTPVGLINVHFEEATGEIDLSQLKTDVDFQNKKSLLYMPQWPSEIERSKILFVPK
jgi:parallel beta-helix repeat protein